MLAESNKLAAPIREPISDPGMARNQPKSRLVRHGEGPAVLRKIELEPNQTKPLDFVIVKYAAGYCNTSISRIAEEGEFEALIGASR